MEPSQDSIFHSITTLFQPGDTIELRAITERGIVNGFYRDADRLAEHAAAISSASHHPPANVYICLNPVKDALFARRANKLDRAGRGAGAGDADIAMRRWLLCDIDAQRDASGISSTDSEKKAAEQLASQVYRYLAEHLGADCLLVCDSGNGYHLVIRLDDIPADDASRRVCEQLLAKLAEQFDNERAKVDRTTFNASRICALWGTVKRKGDSIPDRPHRLTKLLRVPEQLQRADWSKLVELAGAHQPASCLPAAEHQPGGMQVEQLLEHRGVEYSRDDQYRTASGEQATRYILEVCPFDPAHDDRSAAIIAWASNGAISFSCRHNGCSGKGWPELQQLWQLPPPITAADIILPQPKPELLIISSLDVQPEPIEWLWQDRFVMGGINLLAGRGGIGKTYLICDLVARITSDHLPAPNGQPIRHGRVLYSTGEDHIAKVIEPRMQQHGANRSRLEYLKGMPSGRYVQLLDVIAHADLLRDALASRSDTVAMVLDPISSFQGAGVDGNKVSQVRRFTAVLSALAEEFNVAILGIHHFNKGRRDVAGDSISGSHAYRDAGRAIWLCALDASDPSRRLVVCDKSNWAPEMPPGLAYRIEQGRISYEAEPLDMTSDELMAQGSPQSVEIACEWLLGQLAAGPRAAVDIQIAATADGIRERTLFRAKKQLSISSIRSGDRWFWQLPEQDGQPGG